MGSANCPVELLPSPGDADSGHGEPVETQLRFPNINPQKADDTMQEEPKEESNGIGVFTFLCVVALLIGITLLAKIDPKWLGQ